MPLALLFGAVYLLAGAALASTAGLLPALLVSAAVALVHASRALTTGSAQLPAEAGDRPGRDVELVRSLSSTVLLDRRRGVAEKTYDHPPLLVRLLYFISFQSAFPYARNRDSLEAARLRRVIAGLLTRHWFGQDIIAPPTEVLARPNGKLTFVSELVDGTPPVDRVRARRELAELARRFDEAGLANWQIARSNPRAIDNILERPDGEYRVIDLESSLIQLAMSPRSLARALRLGQYPGFDDAYVPQLQCYVDQHHADMLRSLGQGGLDDLQQAIEGYELAAQRWHAGERRLLGGLLRTLFRFVDVPTWLGGARRLKNDAEQRATEELQGAIARWRSDGHLTSEQSARLEEELSTPAVRLVLVHLGMHLGLTLVLRFPLGSLARFGWTAWQRTRAEWAALRGKPVGEARSIHTPLVAAVSLVPGFGAAAYLLAGAVRQHRLLT